MGMATSSVVIAATTSATLSQPFRGEPRCQPRSEAHRQSTNFSPSAEARVRPSSRIRFEVGRCVEIFVGESIR